MKKTKLIYHLKQREKQLRNTVIPNDKYACYGYLEHNADVLKRLIKILANNPNPLSQQVTNFWHWGPMHWFIFKNRENYNSQQDYFQGEGISLDNIIGFTQISTLVCIDGKEQTITILPQVMLEDLE